MIHMVQPIKASVPTKLIGTTLGRQMASRIHGEEVKSVNQASQKRAISASQESNAYDNDYMKRLNSCMDEYSYRSDLNLY